MKKKINILLIIIVVGLWGYIGYRLVNNLSQDPIQEYQISKYKTELLDVQRDTFDLEPLERDPFLNKATSFQESSSKKTYRPHKSIKDNYIEKKNITPTQMPKIQYYGFIKSGINEELAVLKVNNQLLKLHKGESNNGLLIEKIYKDSVLVNFNKQRRIIKSN